MAQKKNPAAVALGRLGGRSKVTKGIGSLSPEARTAIAKQGAKAMWAKKRAKAAKKVAKKGKK